jgi:hypothetical protein
MKNNDSSDSFSRIAARPCNALLLMVLLAPSPRSLAAESTPEAASAFNAYASGVELRLASQHRLAGTFLVMPAAREETGQPMDARLRRGDVVVERLTPPTGAEFAGAMLHHWRGTAFVAGATVPDFERLMQDFPAYPEHFHPQVLRARLIMRQGDRLEAAMRVRQQHVLTVVMDTAYDIRFGRLDARHGYSMAHSTRISEIDAPGTSREHALDAEHEHGFLWRQDTYWSYEERDGGLYMQVEAVCLTRDLPRGLGWAVGPFVESVPRESLEFTLSSVSRALRK